MQGNSWFVFAVVWFRLELRLVSGWKKGLVKGRLGSCTREGWVGRSADLISGGSVPQ